MKIFDEIRQTPEFEKDLKKLLKKYRTLKSDLDVFIDTALKMYHRLGIEAVGIHQIPGLGFDKPKIYKAKKFACRALKGTASNSGIRVIYAYYDEENFIELIEIYFKGNKENEDKARIIKHYT